MRQTHMLSPVRGDQLPTAFVTFDSALVHQPQSDSDTGLSLEATLVCYQHTRFDRPAGQQNTVGHCPGRDFALKLKEFCRPGTVLWSVGRDAYRQLVAMRFFQAVNGTDWELVRALDEPSAGEPPAAKKRRAGFVVLEPRVTILVLNRPDGGTLNIVDISNYGVSDLPGWGKDPTTNAMLLMRWIRRWRQWLADNHAGTWRFTLGSQAMYAYRRRYIDGPIVCHSHAAALQLEGDSLYGGRCELFRHGPIRGPVYHLDVRSLYGAIASQARVPIALQGYGTELPDVAVPEMDTVIADVSVDLADPLVPYRDPERGITIWPTGKFRTTLCGPELQLISERVTAVHRVAWYQSAPIFARWAADSWRLRQAAEKAGYQPITDQMKLWGQQLYGKFAQKYRGWQAVPTEPTRLQWALWWAWDNELSRAVAWRSVAGRVERHVDAGWADHACPAIAAWVTSLARVWLWRAIIAAGRGNVYYCDTDSLFISRDGMTRLLLAGYSVGPNLGDWRLEGTYQWVEFRGVKHYVADGRLVCAGLRQRVPETGDVEPVTIACRNGRAPIPLQVSPASRWAAEYQHGRLLPAGDVEPWDLR